jgi:hypothetical protein
VNVPTYITREGDDIDDELVVENVNVSLLLGEESIDIDNIGLLCRRRQHWIKMWLNFAMEESSQLKNHFNFLFLTVVVGYQPVLKNGFDAVMTAAVLV